MVDPMLFRPVSLIAFTAPREAKGPTLKRYLMTAFFDAVFNHRCCEIRNRVALGLQNVVNVRVENDNN
jgi:hypothetical protein